MGKKNQVSDVLKRLREETKQEGGKAILAWAPQIFPRTVSVDQGGRAEFGQKKKKVASGFAPTGGRKRKCFAQEKEENHEL